MSDEGTQGDGNDILQDPDGQVDGSFEAGVDALMGILSSDPAEGGEVETGEPGGDEPQTSDDDLDDEPDDEPDDVEDDEPEDEPDDDEHDEDDDEPSTTPESFTVKVEGEEIEVTLDEALAGYMRQSAFTRKTQEVAEQRKTLRSEAEQLAAERQLYARKLQVVERALQQQTGDEPNWSKLKQEDPAQYAELRAAYQERREQIEAVQAEIERTEKETEEAIKAARERIQADEAEMLVAKIPEWIDSDVALAEKRRMAETAITAYGFTPEDLGNVTDHRLLLVLRDAMRWNEQQTKSQAAKAAARANKRKGKTLPPGTSTSTSTKSRKSKGKKISRKSLDRLAQTGSVNDAAAALLEAME